MDASTFPRMSSGPPPQGTTQGPSIWLAEVAVIGMALIWGINYSVIKFGTSLMNPLAYNGLRVAISALAMLTIAMVWGGAPPSRRDLLLIIALGALGNGVYQIFFAEGIHRTRAGEAALVVGASPALMALFGRMAGVERVTRWSIVGIAISILGVGLIVLGRATAGSGPEGGSLFGDLLVLCGAICWAIYTILLIPVTKRQNGLWVVGLSLVGGTIVLLLAGSRQILALSWPDVPFGAWMAMLYGSLGGLVIAYLLWYRGVKVLGPTRTALFGNLQPLIALAVAWITLRETPTLWQSVGAAAIVGGVLLTRAAAPVES
jgi:drug/metabolite transporter (DMT)-like permease